MIESGRQGKVFKEKREIGDAKEELGGAICSRSISPPPPQRLRCDQKKDTVAGPISAALAASQKRFDIDIGGE
jgi:hypothetical protein